MANHKSSQKSIRQIEKRTKINSDRKGRIRTALKKVEAAIATGDQKAANEAFKAAQPELARGTTKGIVKKNTVARKLSRLTKRIKALAA